MSSIIFGAQSVVTEVQLLVERWFDEDGQGLTEYALILTLIALLALLALTFLGGSVTSELSTVSNSL